MKKLLVAAVAFSFSCNINAQTFPERIKPLLETTWGQNKPYNMLCPKVELADRTEYMLAGCVPVAMAQVIKHYQYPKTSPDGKYNYDWSNMPNAGYIGMSDAKVIAVGKLISDCGVVARTKYGSKGSASFYIDAITSLRGLFGYSKYMRVIMRDSLKTPEEQAEMKKTLFEELNAGRPIIVSAKANPNKKNADSRHMFVIDGCKEDKVHVNWGWSGRENGYYDLDKLNGYSLDQKFIIGISPDYKPEIKTITVDAPGKLGDLINTGDKHLKICGPLNNDDFKQFSKVQKSLLSIDLKDAEIEAIPDSAFQNYRNLVYAALPENTKTIGRAAFSHCRSLTSVELPSQLKGIQKAAFIDCVSLVDIKIPQTIEAIGSNAFAYNRSLIYMQLPEGMKLLGRRAFYNCAHLFSVNMPKSLVNIGEEVTAKCPNLNQKTQAKAEL